MEEAEDQDPEEDQDRVQGPDPEERNGILAAGFEGNFMEVDEDLNEVDEDRNLRLNRVLGAVINLVDGDLDRDLADLERILF